METKLLKEAIFMPHPQYPNVEMYSVVDENLSTHYRCAIVKVLPGGAILPHTHETLEVAHIIEGQGELLLNGKYEAIAKGETMYAPAGVVHGMRNVTESDMILFATFPDCEK